MGFTTSDLTDQILQDFITDAQAFVKGRTKRTYAEGDDHYELARGVVTDLAVMYALVRLTGDTTSGLDYKIGRLSVEKKGQLENRLRVIFELKIRAREDLAVLEQETWRYRMHVINGASQRGTEPAHPRQRGQRSELRRTVPLDSGPWMRELLPCRAGCNALPTPPDHVTAAAADAPGPRRAWPRRGSPPPPVGRSAP